MEPGCRRVRGPGNSARYSCGVPESLHTLAISWLTTLLTSVRQPCIGAGERVVCFLLGLHDITAH